MATRSPSGTTVCTSPPVHRPASVTVPSVTAQIASSVGMLAGPVNPEQELTGRQFCGTWSPPLVQYSPAGHTSPVSSRDTTYATSCSAS